jgi:hypothetical protein
VRDHLSRLLKAKDKFVTMINDPYQMLAVGDIDQWEEETRKYLRENLSEAHEIVFMDTTGVPRPPIYKWEEPEISRWHHDRSRGHPPIKNDSSAAFIFARAYFLNVLES